MAKKKCIFLHKGMATFTKGDLGILREHFEVVVIESRYNKGFGFLIGQLEVFFRLLYHLPGSEFLFIWFAGYHSVLSAGLSRLMSRKLYLVIGGYDAAYLPEIGYGGHLNRFRSWCIKQSCKWSTIILPVSVFAYEQLSLHLSAVTMTKSQVVYNGVDLSIFQPVSDVLRRKTVATICGASDLTRLKVKGGDFFVEVANANPDITFLMVGLQGSAKDWVVKYSGPNLEITPWAKHEELPTIFSSISVICQFSRYEAFGVAVVEGMACGCIPVGCTFTATKELIEGSAGLLIDELEVGKGGLAVREALAKASPETAEKIRSSILRKFSIERRRKELLDIVIPKI